MDSGTQQTEGGAGWAGAGGGVGGKGEGSTRHLPSVPSKSGPLWGCQFIRDSDSRGTEHRQMLGEGDRILRFLSGVQKSALGPWCPLHTPSMGLSVLWYSARQQGPGDSLEVSLFRLEGLTSKQKLPRAQRPTQLGFWSPTTFLLLPELQILGSGDPTSTEACHPPLARSCWPCSTVLSQAPLDTAVDTTSILRRPCPF